MVRERGSAQWMWLVVVCMMGCISGGEVVEEADQEVLEGWLQHEVVEEEVQFQAGETTVYGMVARAEGVERSPAVVLVAGSGPTDRDWNNPLLPGENGTAIELSRRLAQTGVAVLRYDKRGTGETALEGDLEWEDYLREVAAAVSYMKGRDDVEEGRVVLGGHSEGGLHALRAVSEEWVEVSGTMLLATPGRNMAVVLEEQVRNQLERGGLDEAMVEEQMSAFVGALQAIAEGREVRAREVTQIPGLASLLEMLQEDTGARFAGALLRFDPTRAMGEMEGPVLVLATGRDLQVDPVEDGRRLEASGQDAGVEVSYRLAEQADHVLKHQPMAREDLNEQQALTYNDPTRRLDEGALQAMIEWLWEEAWGDDG